MVSESHNLNLGVLLAVHDGVRKPTQWQAACAAFGGHMWNGCAKTWMALDQLQRVLNLGEEPSAKSGALLFVPRHGRTEFVSGGVLDTEALVHLRRISASIWRRTSSQSVLPVVPASSAAHRRSISVAHASSISAASPSRAMSRLSINRAAISARSCSESPSASCKILPAGVVTNGIVAPGPELTKPLHPTAAMRQLGESAGASTPPRVAGKR